MILLFTGYHVLPTISHHVTILNVTSPSVQSVAKASLRRLQCRLTSYRHSANCC